MRTVREMMKKKSIPPYTQSIRLHLIAQEEIFLNNFAHFQFVVLFMSISSARAEADHQLKCVPVCVLFPVSFPKPKFDQSEFFPISHARRLSWVCDHILNVRLNRPFLECKHTHTHGQMKLVYSLLSCPIHFCQSSNLIFFHFKGQSMESSWNREKGSRICSIAWSIS